MSEALRLFLIEDDDDIALLIRKSLERASHEVTCCRTAADALIVLGQTSFDLVLLDQGLDDMTGLELLHIMAREGISVPVLMVTGKGDETLATRVLRAGALDYIVKDHALTFLAELPKRVSDSVTRSRLEHTNRLLVQALESARDGIMLTDLQGTILRVNGALENLSGYSRQELLGQTPRLFRSGAHPGEFYREMWRTILARASWQGELTNRRKDGSLYQTSMTISPIVDNQGRLTHFVGIQRDITAHKQLERQLLQAQKMQSVGTLAGGVAHEFNNLLAGINGYAALGLRDEGRLPEEVREFLLHIVSLSERAASLTRQLLAFARKPALVRQRTNISDLMRDTAEMVQRTLHQEVRLELPTAGERSGPLLVEADANQLQQALVNLALNARDAVLARQAGALEQRSGGIGEATSEPGFSAAEPGWPTSPIPGPSSGVPALADAVLFRLRHTVLVSEQPGFPQRVPPGDYLVLEVQDRGSGMTSEILNQALDPFFTTKEVGQGTGLGLPMVFGIVQGHQGFMTIDSRPGVGTCIRLYLPRLLDRPAERGLHLAVLDSDPEVVEPESTPGRSILVIDDEEAVLDVVCRFLQIAGHRVSCAMSGHAALEMLTNGRPIDLIILDLMMPREDPTATFQRLRQRRPGVPVLLCTGLAESDPAPELLRSGAAGLLRKPFRMNELWYAVRKALQGAAEEKATR
jgi:PAS domain S-box-containing protein